MKKTLAILMTAMLIIFALGVPTYALADTGDVVAQSSTDMLIETAVNIVATFAVMLISVFGAWLTSVIGKTKKFETVNAAQKELIRMAQITVGELKQTISDRMKEASADGKLTNTEIKQLNVELIRKTKEKMSVTAIDVLSAAAVDINKLIIGAGEDWIGQINAAPEAISLMSE